MKGFYIHIPYCSRVCTYCDFFKRIDKQVNIDLYIDALVKEISTKPKDYDTLYIGGGTPSIIGIKNFEKLFKVLKTDVLEFTIECNPSDINKELLDLFKKNAVSRISLGVQSFNDDLLKSINRDHDKRTAVRAVKLIKEYDFILNIDMIYSIPTQSMINLEQDLKQIKVLDIDSISYYSLILEEKTVLYHKYLKEELEINQDLENKMYDLVEKRLKSFGFYKYENSNYTKKHESIHNKIYWNNQDYYASGAGAVEKLDSNRYTRHKNTSLYIASINDSLNLNSEIEEISLKDKIFEEVMLKFRLVKGLNVAEFYKKYNYMVFDVFPSLKKLIKTHYLISKNDKLHLTKKGFKKQNYVLTILLEDIEKCKIT